MPISKQSYDHRIRQYRNGPNPRAASQYARQRGNADAATWAAAYAQYETAHKAAKTSVAAHAAVRAKYANVKEGDLTDDARAELNAAAEAEQKGHDTFRDACRAYNKVTAGLPKIKR